jgi:hypothetical protein
MNLVDAQAKAAQDALRQIASESPDATLRTVRKLVLPARHEVRDGDVDRKRLEAVLALAYEREFRDFASFLLLENLGPRTCSLLP